jgi:hypothetical protein
MAKIIIMILIVLPQWSFGQDSTQFDIAQASLYYPHRYVPGKVAMEVAMSQVKLPFDWLETSVQAPLFHFHLNYALPKNFTLDTRLSSLIVSNQISIGPRWQFQKDKVSFNVGYDVAYAFGFLHQFDFDSSVKSWINYPNLSVGYRFKDITFTLKGEMAVVTSFTSKQGENVVTTDNNFNNGYTLAIYMEQRIHKDKVMVIGFKNSYARYHFMAWPAFSTFNRYYNIPELYIGLVL